jgi:hypothetical protein
MPSGPTAASLPHVGGSLAGEGILIQYSKLAGEPDARAFTDLLAQAFSARRAADGFSLVIELPDVVRVNAAEHDAAGIDSGRNQ